MTEAFYTEIKVIDQGDPALNEATVRTRHDDIVYLSIDLKTKHCSIVSFCNNVDGVPGFFLTTTEHTPVIGETSKWTTCSLPEFVGWQIEMAECVRYTVRLLLRPETP